MANLMFGEEKRRLRDHIESLQLEIKGRKAQTESAKRQIRDLQSKYAVLMQANEHLTDKVKRLIAERDADQERLNRAANALRGDDTDEPPPATRCDAPAPVLYVVKYRVDRGHDKLAHATEDRVKADDHVYGDEREANTGGLTLLLGGEVVARYPSYIRFQRKPLPAAYGDTQSRNYRVVVADSKDELDAKIEDWIAEGWNTVRDEEGGAVFTVAEYQMFGRTKRRYVTVVRRGSDAPWGWCREAHLDEAPDQCDIGRKGP